MSSRKLQNRQLETEQLRRFQTVTEADGVPGVSTYLSRISILLFAVSLVLVQFSCAPLAPADPVADNLSLTSANGPLPFEACKPRLSLAYEVPGRMLAGQRITIHLLVQNASREIWPYGGQPDGRYQIKAGNRWLDQQGKVVEDARGALPYDLLPGGVAEVLLVITAPEARGNHTLEFDLIQEQVMWFRDKGSETLRMGLLVE